MAVIPVPDWAPDQPDLGNTGALQLLNALPGVGSYKPMPSYQALTGAIDDRCRGAIEARDKDLNVYQYAGDDAKLYRLSGTTWTDSSVSGGYALGTEEIWEFARWKNQVLATNFDDNMQFLELGGTTFADLTTAFKARRICVVRDHVVAANTWDAVDGNVPDRVRTCSLGDETAWTVDPNTGSIARDIKSGPILKTYGGDYGWIFTADNTYRMDWVGAPTWFQINPTLEGIGIVSPGATARIGDVVYAWTNRGMVAISNATSYQPIGAGKVDTFLFNDLDDSYLYRMSAYADPRSGRVFWAYPGPGNNAGQPNKIAVYDRNFDKWSYIEQEIDLLWGASGIGTTVEQLDNFDSNVETLTPSTDSSVWKGGGALVLAGFDTSFQHGFFDGAPMTAVLETKEVEIHEGQQTTVSSYRPLVNGGSFTACIGHRNDQADERSYTTVRAPTATGRVTERKNARYHTFKMNISDAWTDVLGVQVNGNDAKVSGRRGRTD